MATNIYSDQSTFNIDSLNVLDFIVKFNTVTFINLEIIFNCDMLQIINKYSVDFALVNPNNTATVYAQFTPSGTDFGVIKNTIPINGGLTSYTQQLGYFTLRYVDNNHFKSNNSTLTTNTPAEGSQMRLRITVNGVDKYFGTRTFSLNNPAPMPSLPTTFNYLQNYDLAVTNYYFENTDTVKLKVNNQTSVVMSVNNINNYATNITTPVRNNNVNDFIRTPTAKCSFSGTNSYALVKNYSIVSALTQTTIWTNKGGSERKINPPILQPNSFVNTIQVGCNKLFNTTLKNASGVSDTIYLEFPLFMGLSSSGLAISSMSITSNPTKVNFASAPVFTSLGLGKFKIDLSYSPTGEANNTTASYTATVAINFTHPTIGIITVSASGFVYTNSTG